MDRSHAAGRFPTRPSETGVDYTKLRVSNSGFVGSPHLEPTRRDPTDCDIDALATSSRDHHPMVNAELEALAAVGGFVTRPQILAAGYDDRVIASLLRGGKLERIGAGLYAPRESHRALNPSDRHIVRCHAVATRLGESAAFSHQSAALLLGLDVWGIDLDQVHVTRLDDGRGRHQAGVTHHVAGLGDDDVVVINGLLVVRPARTVWDLAVVEPTEQALVTADSALHRGATTDDELHEVASRHSTWRGARHAKATLSLSDAQAESPGETRSRFAFRRFGIPAPESQLEVFDADGVLIGRSDFGWRAFRHLAEFDGMLKYRSTNDDPQSATRAVTAEKLREDALRSMGWGMTRIVWADLGGPARERMIARLRADLHRSRLLYVAAG